MKPVDVCVAHLVRAQNGLAPFEAFLRSYRDHEAATAHRLVLLAKGFTAETFAPYRERAAFVDHDVLHLPDEGFDIGPYREAARRLPHRTWCFLNSFSEIRVDGWLANLVTALDRPGIGLVGATGSWASHASMLRDHWGFGGPYRPVLRRSGVNGEAAGRAPPGRVMKLFEKSRKVAKDPSLLGKALIDASNARTFPAFPAPHIRTNAFAIRRDVMNAVTLGPVRTKWDAYRFESARDGLTLQIQAMGYRIGVVDRRGALHPPEAWRDSHTFWAGDQENLLVADNQTRDYAEGTLARRSYLYAVAWGRYPPPEAVGTCGPGL